MNDLLNEKPTRYLIPGILLVGLSILAYLVLREFLITITWSLIIAYVMWPVYRWLKNRLDHRKILSAALMLDFLGEGAAAERVRAACAADAGTGSTTEIGSRIAAAVAG